ncbi:serine hydrolase [uncultured Polaribacter sp.]|uniref:serine hydrolase domain-containing protein n=1 Tax=uncultured Polaribacter sp. TaxID=174711 RepID=UPI002623A1B5|nr:serine hydrolase [uncultured Polaribacter sp.]
MKSKNFIFLIAFFMLLSCSEKEVELEPIQENNNLNNLYFPPINADNWDKVSSQSLNWNTDQLEPLLNFLEEKNTKSFIILYNGRIVVEEYFNNHNVNRFWYWASAGKTLTASITGIAQEEGFININNKVADYLGQKWTSIPLEKENLITPKNLLSMSSGLDDSLGNDVASQNLKYIADANQRWAYHNVYVKLQDIVEQATKTSWETYFNDKLKNKIGMTGGWRTTDNFNVYWSNTRSMARFGLLNLANGKWENTQIIPETFLLEATNTSQNINLSYGYLWWLNGKSSFHLPQSQQTFSGNLIPDAPKDTFCALGKNDQKIYVVPSKKLVIVRMGESAENSNFALSSFDNELWEKINAFVN